MLDEETNKKEFYANTSIDFFYDLLIEEYRIEKETKNSFDTRAGIIIGFLGILAVYVYDNFDFYSLLSNLELPLLLLPSIVLLLTALMIYSFFSSLYYAVKVLNISEYRGIRINDISKSAMRQGQSFTKAKYTIIYKEIVVSYRKNNSSKAFFLQKSLHFMLGSFIIIFLLHFLK